MSEIDEEVIFTDEHIYFVSVLGVMKFERWSWTNSEGEEVPVLGQRLPIESKEEDLAKLRLDLGDSFKMPSGTRPDPILGYRTWNPVLFHHLDRPNTRTLGLASAVFNGVWTRPVLRNKRVPVLFDGGVRGMIDRHRLGYYAFNIENAHKCIQPAYLFTSTSFEIYGIISMFGTVVTHEYGYRSQNVRVDEIIIAALVNQPDRPIGIELYSGKGIDLATDEEVNIWGPRVSHFPSMDEVIKGVPLFMTSLGDIRDRLMQLYGCEAIILPPGKVVSYMKWRNEERKGD